MFLSLRKLFPFPFVIVMFGVSLIGCGSNSTGFQLAEDLSETDTSAIVATNAKHVGPVIKDSVKLPAGRTIRK
jgi:hypothetical protein